jgi:hypothetical protein
MLQWKVRLAFTAVVLLSAVGGNFGFNWDWLRQFGW